MDIKHKSLKRDKYKYGKEFYTYVYNEGDGIDCFNRLRLSKKSLEYLLKIGRLERRAVMPGYSEDYRVKCANRSLELWEKFREQFYNPFELDVEFVPSEGIPNIIAFDFWDYDYSYRLEHHWEGCWTIECRKSFYTEMDEPIVEMDSL